MAEINFYIKYFIKAEGKEWSEFPEELTESWLQECSVKLKLDFNGSCYEPNLVDLSEINTWSEVPEVFSVQGFDAFASIYVVFDVDDELIGDLALDSESDEYADDIDEILGKGVYQFEAQMPITRPSAIQIIV